MAIYYPTCAVALYCRLEEFMMDLPPEAKAALADPNYKTDLGLYVLPDGRWTQVKADGSGEKPPDVVAKAIKESVYLWTIPKSLRIRKNPYRQADEVTCSIRFSDLPMDPRVVRSLGIAAYMGTVRADDWAERMAGGVAVSKDGKRHAAYSLTSLINRENLRFVGFADETSMSFSEGGDYVNIQGRDFTQLLIDYPVPTSLYNDISWDWPLDRIVWEVLQSLPAVAGVPLHLLGFSQGEIPYERAGHHVAGEPDTTKRRSRRTRKIDKETYWDLLTDITIANGLILYADVWTAGGTDKSVPSGRFVLATPRNLYSKSDDPRFYFEYKPGVTVEPGDFSAAMFEPSFADKGRKYGDGSAIQHPLMVYGHNLKSMELSRRLGKIKIPAVELVCADPDNGETLRARWPSKPSQDNKYSYDYNTLATGYVPPSGLWAKDEIQQYPVTGFKDKKTLEEAAHQVFEDLGRGDLTLKFETLDMASFGGGNTDPDLLELKPGSPLEVVTAKQSEGAVVGSREVLAGMDQEQLEQWLLSKGHSADAAKSLAQKMAHPAYRNLLERRYYVKEVELSMDNEDGFSCSVEAVNYLTSRVLKVDR